MKTQREEQTYSSVFTSFVLEGGGWSPPHPSHFTPRPEPLPIGQEAGWGAGLVWTGAENVVPTTIQTLDHPGLSETP